MKIHFDGNVTKSHILARLEEALTGLEDAGIDSFQACSINFETHKDNERVCSVNMLFHEVDMIVKSTPVKYKNGDPRRTYIFEFYRDLQFIKHKDVVEIKARTGEGRLELERAYRSLGLD